MMTCVRIVMIIVVKARLVMPFWNIEALYLIDNIKLGIRVRLIIHIYPWPGLISEVINSTYYKFSRRHTLKGIRP